MNFSRPNRRGFALVVVLSLITILVVVLVAFLNVMQTDLRSSNNYSQGVKADEIAKGAMVYIEGQLLDEIAAGSIRYGISGTASDTMPPYVYYPSSPDKMLPEAAGVPKAAGATLSDHPPLVKVSKSGLPFYSSGLPIASAASSTSSSINGRRVSLYRWNKPKLLDNWSDSSFAPDWINFTRGGPKLVTVEQAKNSLLGNPEFVVGRFAFAIYETGGLLNINLAGYPSSGTDLTSEFIAQKGTLGLSNLTTIPKDPNGGMLTSLEIDALCNWRNKASNPSLESNYLGSFIPGNGGQEVFPGDDSFVNRQDLIQYAATHGVEGALPYLSTFHAASNAPSFAPEFDANAPFQYKTDANEATAINRFFPNVRVKREFTRPDGTIAKVGEPLVKQRFPLSRLALLSQPAPDAEKIRLYFGLSGTGGNETWRYDHGDPNRIMNLEEVADLANPREPDFFELLKATILQGSLGKSPGVGATSGTTGVFSDVDTASAVGMASNLSLHVLRVGANIIDQYDENSFPTAIHCELLNPVTSMANTVYGVENLPYFWRVAPFGMDTTPPTFPVVTPPVEAPPGLARIWLQPILWNPHQEGAAVSAALAPSKLRIQALGASRIWVTYRNAKYPGATGDTNALGPLTSWQSVQPSSGPSLTTPGCIEFSANQDFRTTPIQLNESNVDTVNTPPDNLPGLNDHANWTMVPRPAGIAIPGYPWRPDSVTITPSSRQIIFEWRPSPTTSFALQYEDEGVWRTYAVVNAIRGRINTRWSMNTAGVVNPSTQAFGTGRVGDHFQIFDPRTDRFGISVPSIYPLDSTYRTGTTQGTSFLQGSPKTTSGFFYDSQYASPIYYFYPGRLTQNFTGAGSQNMYYADKDGVVRGADGRFAEASLPDGYPLALPANGALVSGSQRPLVLNRSFRSVGELGYAFRDLPFKTLDFFTDDSADAGLLDVFCLEETATSADKVNVNSAPAPVLKALLHGGLRKETETAKVLSADVDSLAAHVKTKLSATPALSRADLVKVLGNDLDNILSAAEDKGNKTQREAAIRALAEVSNVRTWNFLIDIVAQSGRYSSTASNLDAFVVNGERRYWLHLAIDRFTGNIVSKRLEIVYE